MNDFAEQEKQIRREKAERQYPGYLEHARFLRRLAAGFIAARYVLLILQGILMSQSGFEINLYYLFVGGIAGLLWIWLANARSWKFAIVGLIFTGIGFAGTLSVSGISTILYFWRMELYSYAFVLLFDAARFFLDAGYYLYFIVSRKAHFTVQLNYETAHPSAAPVLLWGEDWRTAEQTVKNAGRSRREGGASALSPRWMRVMSTVITVSQLLLFLILGAAMDLGFGAFFFILFVLFCCILRTLSVNRGLRLRFAVPLIIIDVLFLAFLIYGFTVGEVLAVLLVLFYIPLELIFYLCCLIWRNRMRARQQPR